MKGTLCLVLLATLCVFTLAQSSCRFRNNTNPTTHCVQSVSTSELKIKLRNQMVELKGTLNSLLRTAQSQPFYRTWFPNTASLGNFINPVTLRTPPGVGQAAPNLEKCFHPRFFNLTLVELQRKLDGQPHQFSTLLAKIVSQMSDIAEGLKKVALSDSRVNAGPFCLNADVRCLVPSFSNTLASGQPVTQEQDRLRRVSNFSYSLQNYIIDLLWNTYWTTR